MAWRSDPTGLGAFEATNTSLSTSPESGFVKTLSVQRRSARAVDILRGLVLARVGDGAYDRTLESRAELRAALADVFGFDLSHFADPTLEGLWERTYAAHLAWEAAPRP
jgi:hypothetical protein